jgi:phospholipid/cholesterol/gamma-HCH transport system permease protein
LEHQQVANIIQTDHSTLSCLGMWTHQGVSKLSNHFAEYCAGSKDAILIQGEQITHMDTIGAWRIRQLLDYIQQQGGKYKLTGFSPQHRALIEWLQQQDAMVPPCSRKRDDILTAIGKKAISGIDGMVQFLAFLGEFFTCLAYGIEVTGYQALPIVMLLTFLVGIVLTYQVGVQLRHYGANIFVVDLLGIALLREFAPLLAAIIIAGRTGSAYTAQLGTMKLNQEFDALQTMGLSPMSMLVLPKVFALLIALPLLTVVADCVGVLGGMLMAKSMLQLSMVDFLSRFVEVVELKNYVIGLVKAPVFAALIAVIGCYQGFQVHASATSVGQRTTTSVVQAIFAIIVADAAFSILFERLGI